MRGKPERFADHYTRQHVFWNSQVPSKRPYIDAFRFEMTRCKHPRYGNAWFPCSGMLQPGSGGSVAEGLGMRIPPAQPRATQNPPVPEVASSPALLAFCPTGEGGTAHAGSRFWSRMASMEGGSGIICGLSSEQAVRVL